LLATRLDIAVNSLHFRHRIRVLRANIIKLFLLCVPIRQKWCEFGWVGKSVDEILDELTNEEIPPFHPGDPEFPRDNDEDQQQQQQQQKEPIEQEDKSIEEKNYIVN
jgi:hypothetical protein